MKSRTRKADTDDLRVCAAGFIVVPCWKKRSILKKQGLEGQGAINIHSVDGLGPGKQGPLLSEVYKGNSVAFFFILHTISAWLQEGADMWRKVPFIGEGCQYRYC
jgi:hypothetical protein